MQDAQIVLEKSPSVRVVREGHSMLRTLSLSLSQLLSLSSLDGNEMRCLGTRQRMPETCEKLLEGRGRLLSKSG